jgi:choline-sulfatase
MKGINRRKFISLLPAGAAAAKAAAAQAGAAANSRPNFLLLLADDLTYRAINSLNNKEVHTPNLDRLAAQGCAFTHCFHQGSWSGAVCVPSRTMLNTGLSAFRAETHASEVPLWGQTLRKAGYDTCISGKWHLDPVLLGRSFNHNGPVGPDMLHSTPVGGAAYNRPTANGDTWSPTDTKWGGHWLHTDLWKNEDPSRIEHSDSVYADFAINYIQSRAHAANPFFLYVGFNSPHDPRQSPQEILDRYPREKIEVPPNFLPDHPFDQGDARCRDEILAPFPRTHEAVQTHRREYYGLITYMDSQVGRILDALEASGQAGNTYVILTADHGIAIGEHGLMGKQNLYDCSVRMPLLIAGPGIARGSKVDDMVYQHSMYATTCELAGIPIPQHVEFPSIVPQLKNQSGHANEAVYCRYIGFQRSVRTARHKLIVYPRVDQVQLFDIEQDPWETKNLINDPALAQVKKDLWQRLKSFQHQLDDPLVLKDI